MENKTKDFDFVLKQLKSGEPFYYRKFGNRIIIGVRMGYDDKHDEYEIYFCESYKMIKNGIIRKLKSEGKDGK